MVLKKDQKDISEGTSNSQIQAKVISGGRIMKNIHIGSSFDDFLKEEDLLVESEATAAKRLLDPENPSVTLLTLENVAIALGKRLKIQIG